MTKFDAFKGTAAFVLVAGAAFLVLVGITNEPNGWVEISDDWITTPDWQCPLHGPLDLAVSVHVDGQENVYCPDCYGQFLIEIMDWWNVPRVEPYDPNMELVK